MQQKQLKKFMKKLQKLLKNYNNIFNLKNLSIVNVHYYFNSFSAEQPYPKSSPSQVPFPYVQVIQ